jgi:hypothetical protein
MVEQPAQLDSSREPATLVKDGADGGGLFLADDEHPKSCEREPCPASGDCITVCRVLVYDLLAHHSGQERGCLTPEAGITSCLSNLQQAFERRAGVHFAKGRNLLGLE